MERKYRLATVMLTLLLTGCGGTEGDAIKVVKETLKDPDSAKFGEFTEINDRLACLTVNCSGKLISSVLAGVFAGGVYRCHGAIFRLL